MQLEKGAELSKKTVFAIMLSILVVSTLTLAFKIQSVNANDGPVYIRADGSVDPPNAPIYTADNITYTLTGNIAAAAEGIVIERDNIVIDGAGYTIQSTNASISEHERAYSEGIYLAGRNNVTIRNLEIKAFGGYGIALSRARALEHRSLHYARRLKPQIPHPCLSHTPNPR